MWTLAGTAISGITKGIHNLFSGKHRAARRSIREARRKAAETATRARIAKRQAEAEARLTSETKQAPGELTGKIGAFLKKYGLYIGIAVLAYMLLTKKKKVSHSYRRPKTAMKSSSTKSPRKKTKSHFRTSGSKSERVLKLWRARNKARRSKGLKPVKRPKGY